MFGSLVTITNLYKLSAKLKNYEINMGSADGKFGAVFDFVYQFLIFM